MELNEAVYTTTTTGLGKGFLFPKKENTHDEEDNDPRKRQIELTAHEAFLAASATPEGADFALASGEFAPHGDLAAEGLSAPAGVLTTSLDAVMNLAERTDDADADETADEARLAGAGFDPHRALSLTDEIGEELCTLARTVAEELGSESTPQQFLEELRRRRVQLSDSDREVLTRTRRLGALSEPEREAASVLRLADSGEANLRLIEGELLLVPVGARQELLTQASRRSREAHLGTAARRTREAVIGRIMDHLLRYGGAATLRALEARAATATTASRDEVRGLLRAEVRSGSLCAKRLSRPGRQPVTVLTIPGTPKSLAVRTADRDEALEKQARAHMSAAAKRARKEGRKAFPAPEVPFGGSRVEPKDLPKVLDLERAKVAARDSGRTEARVYRPGWWDCEVVVGEGVAHALPVYRREVDLFGSANGAFHCWPVSKTTVLHDPKGSFTAQTEEERLAAKRSRRRVRCTDAPALDPADRLPDAERESGPDPRGASTPREYVSAERRDAVIKTDTGRNLDPLRNSRQRQAARRRVNRAVARSTEAGKSPLMRAWNTALSLYLGEISDPARRLELLLKTRGPRKWEALERGSKNPAELKAAAKKLADASKLRTRRHSSGSPLYVEATTPLGEAERRELESSLLELMVSGRVTVPKGSRLARRVAAWRDVLARRAGAEAARPAS